MASVSEKRKAKYTKKAKRIEKRIQKASDKQSKIVGRKQEKAERKKAKEIGLPEAGDFKPYNRVHRRKAGEMLKAGRDQRSKTYGKNIRVKALQKKKNRLHKKGAEAWSKANLSKDEIRTRKKEARKMRKFAKKNPDLPLLKKGGSVGDSIKTYSNGGYVEGK